MEKTAQLKQLYDSIGKFIEYWGFKSVHGRIWAMVFVSDQPVATPEITRTLGISKGLASIAINELLEVGLIKRAEKISYGAQTYVAREQVAEVIRSVLRERELELLAQSEARIMQISAFDRDELDKLNVSANRLNDLLTLTQAHRSFLETFLTRNLVTAKDLIKLLQSAKKLLRLS